MAYTGKRFRRHRLRTPGKLHPAAIVAICLGAAIVLTLIVGNILHYTLDEDILKKLTSGTEEPEEPKIQPERKVPLAQIYPFTLGDSLKTLTGGEDGIPPAALSISMNTPDGELLYTSPVSAYQGLTRKENIPLSDKMTELYTAVPYLCGVFYPQAFRQEAPDLFYAAAAQEAALLREFANAGASEILLAGLSFDAEHWNATLYYIELISNALGDFPLGVAVPLSFAAAEQSWNQLPAIQEHASYLALDLQEEPADTPAETSLIHANYYLTEYQMRLLLASDQTELINAVQSYMNDFQILTAPPRPEPEPDPEPAG